MSCEAEMATLAVLAWMRTATHVLGHFAQIRVQNHVTVQFNFDR